MPLFLSLLFIRQIFSAGYFTTLYRNEDFYYEQKIFIGSIVKMDDDSQIIVSGWSVYIESLNLTLRQEIVCVWGENENMFMPDFDITIVYEGKAEAQKWLYYEQDGMVVTLNNWFRGKLSCKQLEQLECELVVPD